jgi:hypothetical protein
MNGGAALGVRCPLVYIPPHRSPRSRPTPGGPHVTIRALFAALPALALFLAPAAAEAKAKKDTTVTCKDGTTDKSGRGACSGHGGVDKAATQAAKAKAEPAAAAATEKAAKPRKAKKAKAEAAAPAEAASAPAATKTVTCKDGTTDTAGRGACSGHGGVDKGTKKAKKAKAAAAEAAAPAPSAAPAPAPAPRAAAPARPAAPAGEKGPPTAKCKDGTLSYAEHHTGACSNHGGVAEWLDGSKK